MTHVDAKGFGPVENISRRGLLKGAAALGGLVLTAQLLPIRPAQAAFDPNYATGAGGMPHGTVNDPRVYVSIASDGTVAIKAARSEMGTGVRTSLPMIVADEMGADWDRVHVVQAEGDEERYGNQDTDGSRSTRHYLVPMRQVGAAARMMLEAAAAKRWGVARDEVAAGVHEVVHASSGRKLGFGELANDAAELPVPRAETLRLKDPKEFRYIGKGAIGIVDLHDITTGKAVYGGDVRLPGMKYAVIARPPASRRCPGFRTSLRRPRPGRRARDPSRRPSRRPRSSAGSCGRRCPSQVVGGKLVSFEAEDAKAVPGVEQVLAVQGWPWPSKFQPLGGVAVIARNTGAAIKGRDALKVVWDDGANAKYDSTAYRLELEAAVRQPGAIVRDDGDAVMALKTADKVVGQAAEAFQAEVVFTMLSDDAAIREVVLSAGILEGARKGIVHAVCSTISVAFAGELEAAHRKAGLAYLSTPVLGRPDVAAKGELNVLVAGDPQAVGKARPLLDVLAKKVWDLGAEPSRANAAKIAANMMITMAIEAMAEAAALTEANGLSRAESSS